MEKITITIHTTNEAFEENSNGDGYYYETARILRELALKLEFREPPSKLKDIDGIDVGTVKYE